MQAIGIRKKQQRKPQNPWPKHWEFPKLKDFSAGLDLDLFHPYFAKKKDLTYSIKNQTDLCFIRKKYPKNIMILALNNTKVDRQSSLRLLKTTKTLFVSGHSKLKHKLPYLQTLVVSDVHNIKDKSQIIHEIVRKAKLINSLMLQNVHSTHLEYILKSMRPLRSPAILHLKFKNDNFSQKDIPAIARLKGVSELRIELKRISMGKTKITDLFKAITKIKKLQSLKLDIYDLVHHNQVNFFSDLSNSLKHIYSKIQNTDIRITQNLNLKIPASADEYLSEIDFLAINMKSKVAYEYQELSKQRLQLQKASKNILMFNMYSAPQIALASLLKKLTKLQSLELIVGENYSMTLDDFWTEIPSLKALQNFSLHYHLFQNKNLLPYLASKLKSPSQLNKVVVEFEGSFQYQHNKSIADFFKSIQHIKDITLILQSNNLSTMIILDSIYENLARMKNVTSFTLLSDELCNQHLENLHALLEDEYTALESLSIELDEMTHADSCNFQLKNLKNLKKLVLKINLQLETKTIDKIFTDIAALDQLQEIEIELRTSIYAQRFLQFLTKIKDLNHIHSINICLDVNIMGITDMQFDLINELKSLDTKKGRTNISFTKGQKGKIKADAVEEILLPNLLNFWKSKQSCQTLIFNHKCAPFTLTLQR